MTAPLSQGNGKAVQHSRVRGVFGSGRAGNVHGFILICRVCSPRET